MGILLDTMNSRSDQADALANSIFGELPQPQGQQQGPDAGSIVFGSVSQSQQHSQGADIGEIVFGP